MTSAMMKARTKTYLVAAYGFQMDVKVGAAMKAVTPKRRLRQCHEGYQWELV
jgi:hypothetical protein